jgi:hypothetical protein
MLLLVVRCNSRGTFLPFPNQHHPIVAQILGARPIIDQQPTTDFILSSQNRFAGIAKNPSTDKPDPYHTYLALACLALPSPAAVSEMKGGHDALLNASMGTVSWIREKLTMHSLDHGMAMDDKGGHLVREKYSGVPGAFRVQSGEEDSAQNQCRIL